MKNINKKSAERFEHLKVLYKSALICAEDTFDKLERHEAQYRASTELDGSAQSAGTVRNITYEIIESEICSDIPSPKVESVCYSEKREKNARSVERLCNAVRARLPFESMNDIDERYTYIYGASIWYVEWDNDDSYGKDVGGVRVHCISPMSFIPQPGVCSVEDMDYCFLRLTTTKSELISKYGINEDELSLAEFEYEYGGEYHDCDTVNVVIAFWRDEERRIGKSVFSGDLLISDTPDYYSRKIRVCTMCGRTDTECKCGGETKSVKIELERIGAGKLIPDANGEIEIAYYTPRSFPIVVRKNTQSSPSLYGLSDCEQIRYQQQAINKIETRILQKLLRSGITPVMPEDSSVSLNNAIFGQVIKMKPGESVDQYGKIDMTPDISQDIDEADRLYEQARRIMGISDALVGGDTVSSESGYAKRLKILQASGRLQSKRQMKYLAYSEIYRLIFEHFLAFADEVCPLSYKDGFGEVHDDCFNKYDFIERDSDGEYAYYDGYLFSVDLNGGSEYLREELWERNLANLKAGTLGDAESPATLLRYWQSQEKAHYPFARENVEYFKAIVEEATKKEREREKNNEN